METAQLLTEPTKRRVIVPSVLIVSSDPAGIEELLGILRTLYPDMVTMRACSIPQGLSLLHEQRPELLLIDMQVDGISGFSMLRALGPATIPVIFLAWDELDAIKALRHRAVDLLTRPWARHEVDLAIARAVPIVERHRSKANAHAGSPVGERQVALPSKYGFSIVHIDEIVHCSSSNGTTEIFVSTGSNGFLLDRGLGAVNLHLGERDFIRIHESHIVHRKHIKRYYKGSGGGEVAMSNGRILPVSRRARQHLLDSLDKL